jgi:serine phosphatase RsbU (regulator of sigma subunit)
VFIFSDKKLHETKPDKQPVGYSKNNNIPFTHHEFPLKNGDTVYIFTDGYQDQLGGGKGKKFKISKLKELLLSIQPKTMLEQKQILETTINEWQGKEEQLDDILIIGLRF